MGAFRLMLLGGFEARAAAGAVVRFRTRKAQALLAYLGLKPGQSHPRDKLATLLWGLRTETRARDGLRHAILAIRKALPALEGPAWWRKPKASR